jgi:ATP-dependent RNA circularization protein (DNA/RNA ligase family)
MKLLCPISLDKLLQAFDPKFLGDESWYLLTAEKIDKIDPYHRSNIWTWSEVQVF